MKKQLMIIGIIITFLSWLLFSNYATSSGYSYGLGSVMYFFFDIFGGEFIFLIFEGIYLIGIIFVLVGLKKKIFGIIGGFIIILIAFGFLLAAFGIETFFLEFSFLAMDPNDPIINGILPLHINIGNDFGIGAIIQPIGALLTIVGGILYKEKTE